MDREAAIALAAAARVGRMATVRPDATPHVVPITFALFRDGSAIHCYWAVDAKPKRSAVLQRIKNLRANPAVEIVVDAYDDDWTRLWWVRLRGTGRVVTSTDERGSAITALAAKYAPYRSMELADDVVAIDVEGVSWWSAGEGPREPRSSARSFG
jgi:PPOX class probable F420-dependent enzyme